MFIVVQCNSLSVLEWSPVAAVGSCVAVAAVGSCVALAVSLSFSSLTSCTHTKKCSTILNY